MLIHLDTDLGGDPDDACALAMLLGWPDVQLTAVTTTIDPGGLRAGCAGHLLRLARRTDVPVIAGAAKSLTRPETLPPATGDSRYWPRGLRPHPASAGAALDALQRSIDLGATVVAIGPYTNLAVLELLRPGALAHATVVVMGGWVDPPEAGLPEWGPERDWNVQWDTQAAGVVLAAAGDLTLVTFPATLAAPLRARDLPRLRASGPVGRLLARQGEARAADAGMLELGKAFRQLPDDLLNFHYDPVTCAAALGWPGAAKSTRRLRPVLAGGVLRCRPDKSGRQFTVVSKVDGEAFAETWLCAVEAADAARPAAGGGR
jgi:inosine-uridine nucleoside N-ribohydrolase